MMARSTTGSNQRPDTLMQDRICRIDETSCNARPDHTVGSKCEKLALSICLPLCPPIADITKTCRHFGFVPTTDITPPYGLAWMGATHKIDQVHWSGRFLITPPSYV